MREARRAMVRIVTNYARLGLNLALGLVFVPFVLHWVGEDALGLIILLGAGVGIAAMFREITTRAVIRELGAAHHAGIDARFRSVFNAALLISLAMAGVAAILFVVLYFCLPLLKIPHDLDSTARVMVISQGVYIFVTTALSPVFNMLVVAEQFVRYNLWVLAERCSMLGSALFVHFVLGIDDIARAISWWSMIVAALQCATFLIPVVHMVFADPRLRPAPALADRSSVRSVGQTMGLYIAVETGSMLYEKLGQVIVNVFFGLLGNAIFGVAYTFVSYVRQATYGVTFGLDAVSARLSTSGQRPLRALMHHSTRLQGLVALPTGVAVFLLAEPLIRLWIGQRLDNPETYLPGIVLTVKIMSISMTARAIAEGWIMILYGAGFIKRYTPLVLGGGLIFPPLVISLLLLLGAPDNPSLTLFIVPGTFCFMHFVIYFLMLPAIASACIGVRYPEMFLPLWRPACVTALASPVLALLPLWLARDPSRPGLVAVAITAAVFGALYAVLTCALVLNRDERQRFVWGPARRLLNRRSPPVPAP